MSTKFTLSVAESCTGGNIAHLITSVPGSSEYFLGGVVSYSNAVKNKVLGVPQELLDGYGAVSRQVVLAMAKGVLRLTGSDYAVATSGIAGPGGAVEGKPVGTVWIAACSRDKAFAEVFHFDGNRAQVIQSASQVALSMLSEKFGVEVKIKN